MPKHCFKAVRAIKLLQHVLLILNLKIRRVQFLVHPVYKSLLLYLLILVNPNRVFPIVTYNYRQMKLKKK